MKPSYALIIVLIFFVFLRIVEASPSDAIYLRERDGFSPVEKVDYEGESRLYIRTMKSGVFLDERQSTNLIEAAYFHRIRESSPRSAAFSSLLMFDAGADYVWYRWKPEQAARLNSHARIWKLATLAVTALSYYAASRSAADVARNPYTTSSSTQKRFELMRNIYYASAATTLGVYSYFTYRAYSGFGHDVEGNDLRIQQRQELPADTIPALNENASRPFHFSFTARFDMGGDL